MSSIVFSILKFIVMCFASIFTIIGIIVVWQLWSLFSYLSKPSLLNINAKLMLIRLELNRIIRIIKTGYIPSDIIELWLNIETTRVEKCPQCEQQNLRGVKLQCNHIFCLTCLSRKTCWECSTCNISFYTLLLKYLHYLKILPSYLDRENTIKGDCVMSLEGLPMKRNQH